METEESKSTSKLNPQYVSYERQKCFISYTEQAPWAVDLLDACKSVLKQPGLALEPDYARKHLNPSVTLREKALELIANARMGIYDVSYWRTSPSGPWHQPRNVFIELGMAVALNRPVVLVRNSSNRDLNLPNFLEGADGSIVEFSGLSTLKQRLEANLPKWVDEPPEKSWSERFCYFGNRLCRYREVYPRGIQLGRKRLICHISDGADVDQTDFRFLVEDVLDRFDEVEYQYLDQVSIAEGYTFLLCSYCQTARTTPFAIYRITPNTPPETFITIGMSIAIERQYGSKIPKILLTENMKLMPSLLSGYDVVVARSDKERKERLLEFLPEVIAEVRKSAWDPVLLPFLEHVPMVDDRSPITDDVLRSPIHYQILIVDEATDWRNEYRRMFLHWFQRRGLECNIVEASSPDEALKLAEDGPIALALIDLGLRNEGDVMAASGLALAGQLKEKTPNTAIILMSDFIGIEDIRRALKEFKPLKELNFADVITKDAGLSKLEQAVVRALGLSWGVDAQEDFRAHSRRLKALSSAGNDNLGLILREFLMASTELTGATHGKIWLYEAIESSLVLVAAVGEPVETLGLSIPLSGIDGRIEPARRAALTKDIVSHGDVVADPSYIGLNQHTRSALSIPLLGLDNELLGALSLESAQTGAFSDEDTSLVMSLLNSIPEVLMSMARGKPKVTCPNCGTSNDFSQNFCDACGQDLRPTRAQMVAALAPPPPQEDVVTDDTPYLETLDRVDEQLEYVLARPKIAIGTARGNDIVIDESFKGWEEVSPVHTELRLEQESFVIVDRDSASGTFVNEIRTSENILADGDMIRLGGVRFIFHIPSPEIEAQDQTPMGEVTVVPGDPGTVGQETPPA